MLNPFYDKYLNCYVFDDSNGKSRLQNLMFQDSKPSHISNFLLKIAFYSFYQSLFRSLLKFYYF